MYGKYTPGDMPYRGIEEKNMVRRQISDNKASPFTVKRYF